MIYRPRREEYEGFMKEFSEELKKHFPEVCFGYFGSYGKNGAVIGKSDIDGFLIMPGGVISDKERVKGLSQVLARALGKDKIKTQFNLLDLESVRDGRFVSYSKDYSDFLIRNARIVSGPEYHLEMNGFHFRSGVLHSAAFNFSGPGGVRNAALYSLDTLQRDYDEFCELIEKAIDKVAKFPKKLIWLKSGRIISCRRKSADILEKHLRFDKLKLDEINGVLDNVQELDQRLQDPGDALKLLFNGLEIMEEMIKDYISKYSFPGKREVVVVDNI
jgi:hypothetical protein